MKGAGEHAKSSYHETYNFQVNTLYKITSPVPGMKSDPGCPLACVLPCLRPSLLVFIHSLLAAHSLACLEAGAVLLVILLLSFYPSFLACCFNACFFAFLLAALLSWTLLLPSLIDCFHACFGPCFLLCILLAALLPCRPCLTCLPPSLLPSFLCSVLPVWLACFSCHFGLQLCLQRTF